MRLTADKPGQVTFKAGMNSPQKATVAVESPDTLLLTGTNGAANGIAGALRFQARVRVLAKGGQVTAEGEQLSVAGADSATLLIAAATSYKSFKDVSGDPAAATKATIAAACLKPFDVLRKEHVTEHQRLCPPRDARLGHDRRVAAPDGTNASKPSPKATIRNSPRSTSSLAAICSSVAPALARSRRTCKGCGTIA